MSVDLRTSTGAKAQPLVTGTRHQALGRLWQPAGVLAIVGLVVALWALLTETGVVPTRDLPSVPVVSVSVWDILNSGAFWDSLALTLQEIVLSFIIGCALGLIVGLLLWRFPFFGRIVEPYVASFYAVPVIVFYPLVVIVIGVNSTSIIFLNVLGTSVPMILNTWAGLDQVPKVMFRLGAALRCRPSRILLQIAIPAAAIQIMAGIRLAASLSIVGVVALQFLLAPAGLGFDVRYSYEYYDQGGMYAYIVLILALAGILTMLISAVERGVLARRA